MKTLALIAVGLAATGCVAYAVTTPSAEDIDTPPPLGGAYVTNTETALLSGDVESVREFMEDPGLTSFLEPTDRIPAIANIEILEGDWYTPGSVRRVDLEGGGFVIERIVDRDDTMFSYQIWNISTLSGRFIDHIYGEISYDTVPGGTEVVWSYNVKPRYGFARGMVTSYVEDDFAPFMAAGLSAMAEAYEMRCAAAIC